MAERIWVCTVCGWMYDEGQGLPEQGVEPGTPFEELPADFLCPECGADREAFELMAV
ncbi:MAG: rubredoxin [Halorhodospira sp.]